MGLEEMTFLVGWSAGGKVGSGAAGTTGSAATGATGASATGSGAGCAGAGVSSAAGAAAAFFEPFFAGSSGCWSRISPSRSALRRTWSA